jgi:hypothetical protein
MDLNLIKIVFGVRITNLFGTKSSGNALSPDGLPDGSYDEEKFIQIVRQMIGNGQAHKLDPGLLKIHNDGMAKLLERTAGGPCSLLLSGRNFHNFNLGGFDMRYADLKESNLYGCVLPEQSEGVNYTNCSLQYAYAHSAGIYKNAVFKGCNMLGFKGLGGDFSEALDLELIDLSHRSNRSTASRWRDPDFHGATVNPSQYEFIRRNFASTHAESTIRVKLAGGGGFIVDCRNMETLRSALERSNITLPALPAPAALELDMMVGM